MTTPHPDAPGDAPSPDGSGRAQRWRPEVFAPFAEGPGVVFARTAARSPEFGRTSASGAGRVLIGSAVGDDRADVALRARGELLERMGNVLAGRAAEGAARWVGDHDGWRRRGVPALDPAELGDGTGGTAGRSVRQLWVPARSALTGAELLVPAGEVFLQHRPPPGCGTTSGAGSTGLGARPDRAAAAGHAALELLERDVIRRSWYGPGAPPQRAVPADDLLPGPVRILLTALGLRAALLTLPAPAGTECAVVCVHGGATPGRPGQSFGARCARAGDRAVTVARAAYEALMVRWSMTSPVALRTWEGWGGRTPPRTALEHALWAFHGQDALGHWTGRRRGRGMTGDALDSGRGDAAGARPGRAGPESRTDGVTDGHGGATRPRPGQEEPGPGPQPSGAVDVPGGRDEGLAALAAHTGGDVLLVDTDTPGIRAEGVHVVRVIAPGARPLPADDSRMPGALPHPFG
ncbi:YcaO-like family protein [Streptomyces rectiverticillatus]|uniref:YcaO-like family protein n=1 Tax=Streptomyces rectiverticillatus TaxID=173860 RepID=UPI0015C2D6D1|nr:YcaO-like family protein [Streptomyces rectiverticillatus]